MVDALEEIHRMLKPDGTLIDIHPFPEPSLVKVIQGDRVLFAEPRRESDHEDVQHAERAIEDVLERKLFAAERNHEFDFFSYGSSAFELREFWDRYKAYDQSPKEEARLAYENKVFGRAEEIRKGSGDDAKVAIHEKAHIVRLKPVRK